MRRDPFKGHRFPPDDILLAVRWYCRSLPNPIELAQEFYSYAHLAISAAGLLPDRLHRTLRQLALGFLARRA